MGRELKRVVLDFAWPLDKTYEGYLNPYYKHQIPCPFCKGSGSSPEANNLKDQWYGNAIFYPENRGSCPYDFEHPIIQKRAKRHIEQASDFYGIGDKAINKEAHRLANLFNASWSHHLNDADVKALVDENRLVDFTSHFVKGEGWVKNDPFIIPTAQQVNDWSIDFGFGHDSINQWVVVKAECKRLGIEDTCQQCEGEGNIWETDEYKALSDAWEPTEPPKGEGYQIWETVSEGSPISPVFATPEDLARYMSGTKWGADEGSSYETWMKFILGDGWAMSMMIVNGVCMSGVEFAANKES
jgi:hypothetical protein